MKLPRWLVIGMVTSSVLALVAAADWWWVTWPERTAREFLDLLASEKIHEAKQLFRWTPEWETREYVVIGTDGVWKQSNLHPEPRDMVGLICGRQHFTVSPGQGLLINFMNKNGVRHASSVFDSSMGQVITINVKRGTIVEGPIFRLSLLNSDRKIELPLKPGYHNGATTLRKPGDEPTLGVSM